MLLLLSKAFASAGPQWRNEKLSRTTCCSQLFCHCDKRPEKTASERTDAFCLMAADVAVYGNLVRGYLMVTSLVIYLFQPHCQYSIQILTYPCIQALVTARALKKHTWNSVILMSYASFNGAIRICHHMPRSRHF